MSQLVTFREHTCYVANPYIESYATDDSVPLDLTVRRMPAAVDGVVRPAIASADTQTGQQPMEADGGDGHADCIAPAPDGGHSDYDCLICFMPAINPMRCTRRMARDSTHGDTELDSEMAPHLICYRCLARGMSNLGKTRIPCPTRCPGLFDMTHMRTPDAQIMKKLDELSIYCPDGCGLYGTPTALAIHICFRAPDDDIGHTVHSLRYQDMCRAVDQQSAKMSALRAEMATLKDTNEKQLTEMHNVRVFNEEYFQLDDQYVELKKRFTIIMEDYDRINKLYNTVNANLRGRDARIEVLLDCIGKRDADIQNLTADVNNLKLHLDQQGHS